MRRGSSQGVVVSIAAVALVAALAGCGGGDDSTSGGSISKAEFLKQGNTICEKGNAAIERAAAKQFPESGGESSRAARVSFVTATVMPSIEAQVAALEALGSPDNDEEAIETFLAEAENALREVKKNPSVMMSGGPGPFAAADKFAASYGLTACGSGSK